MGEEHEIVRLVYEAKEDSLAADRLIRRYMSFIRSEASKQTKRLLTESDDELSIAMIAFHEAITGYSRQRGSFLSYAAMLIKSRLIDFHRREQRHRHAVSLDQPLDDEDDVTVGDRMASPDDHSHRIAERDALRFEIAELPAQLDALGLSLSDIAENCPKQQRTRASCIRLLQYALKNREILEELVRTGKLPIARLAEETKVERKTIERHRKYIVALLIIQTNGYEHIRHHMQQVLKGGA